MQDRHDESEGLDGKLFWICFIAVALYAAAVKWLIF